MKSFKELSEILTAKDVSMYLGISRRRVYDLLKIHPNAGGIKNFDIGFSKRIQKDDFAEWIELQKERKYENLN